MSEHQTTFKVREIGTSSDGLYVMFPSSTQISPGMTVWNSTQDQEQRRFLVVGVVQPPNLDPAVSDPAMMLPGSDVGDFRVGDVVVVGPGTTAEGDLLLQSFNTFYVTGRGLIVAGTSQGTIARGDSLVLRTEQGRHLSCHCDGIERLESGDYEYGEPTRQGEDVQILLSVDCQEELEAIRTGKGESLVREVGEYPSLHIPKKRPNWWGVLSSRILRASSRAAWRRKCRRRARSGVPSRTPVTLATFLAAEDLDELLSARSGLPELTTEDICTLRSIIEAWDPPQAVANLLLNKDLLPEDLRFDTYLRGMDEPWGSYLRFAAFCGGPGIPEEQMSAEQLDTVRRHLFEILERDTGVLASRASLLLSSCQASDAPNVVRFLAHPNDTVAHNVLAWLLRKVTHEDLEALNALLAASVLPDALCEQVTTRVREHLAAKERGEMSMVDKWLYAYIPNLNEWHSPSP